MPPQQRREKEKLQEGYTVLTGFSRMWASIASVRPPGSIALILWFLEVPYISSLAIPLTVIGEEAGGGGSGPIED